MDITKNSRVVKILTQAYSPTNLNADKETFKQDFQASLDYIKELAQDFRNPQNQYELNNIVTYVIDSLLLDRTKYLESIGEVKRTDFKERPQFKYRTQEVEAYWQAPAATADKSRIGFAYEPLKREAISAFPVAEWIEIANGRYDFGELISDVLEQFDIKITQKIQDTLYATVSGLPSPNYGAGNGINQTVFDNILNTMQRMGNVAILGDNEALQKLPSLTAIGGQTSDDIINQVNRSGVIGMYKGATVVKMANPYIGLNGFETALNKGYIYIVPNVRPELKTLKIWFPGSITSMSNHNIDDLSYEMRFDQFMGAGVVGKDHIRQPIGIYEDQSLS